MQHCGDLLNVQELAAIFLSRGRVSSRGMGIVSR